MRRWALCLVSLFPLLAQAADGPPEHKIWEIGMGAGLLEAPAFLGSKDYQLSAVPNLTFKYKDKVFASVQDGLGYNVINRHHWRIGPVVKYAFPRYADGNNPFRIAGAKTRALHGLGDVDGTVELGGFAEYTWRDLSAKLEARQGLGGHDGFISDLNLNYSHDIHAAFYNEGPPLILSFGPRTSVVDSNYNDAYFGVDAMQSAQSGLPRYQAGGGLLSYGFGGVLVAPITYSLTANLVAGYDRLAGDAAAAPLVRQRGSADQFTGGLFLTYSFGK